MLHLKYLLTLENSYIPQKKCDPLTASAAASIAPAAINTVGSLVSSLFGQSSQKKKMQLIEVLQLRCLIVLMSIILLRISESFWKRVVIVRIF